MATAAELRAEAARMREYARTVTDPEVLAEIHAMIDEWERRARETSNGDAAGAKLIERNHSLLTLAADARANARESVILAQHFVRVFRVNADERRRQRALLRQRGMC